MLTLFGGHSAPVSRSSTGRARAVTMMNQVSPDHNRPLLVDMRNIGNTSTRARDVFVRPHSVSRVALLGESPVDEVIASFFTVVHRPQRPTRYFTSEAKALSWLSGD